MRERSGTKDRRDGKKYKEVPPAEIQKRVPGACMLRKNHDTQQKAPAGLTSRMAPKGTKCTEWE